MSAALAIPEPTSLVAVDGTCEAIEAWAETCESVPELRDAGNKLAAIDEYLNRTSAEGRMRVAAAMRRLEARIGALLPPPMTPSEAGMARHESSARDRDTGLTEIDRHTKAAFRQMAEHPEVVEEVIAESTDQAPASRRKVMERIAKAKAQNPVDDRPAVARRMAAEGYTSPQIAREIGIAESGMADFRRRHGIEVPADQVVGRSHRIDANKVLEAMAISLEGDASTVDLIEISQLDPARVEGWVVSLSNSLRSLNRFAKQLKETTL